MDVRAVHSVPGAAVDPATMPAAAPPPGITPDFDRVEPMHYVLIATLVLSMVVSTLVLMMRLMARFFVLRIADWSDYAAILGYAFSMAFMGLALKINEKRRGRHMWHMPLLDYLQTTEEENIASIMYGFGMAFLKLSILFFFLQIFMPTRRGAVYWTNICLSWLNGLFYSGCIVALIFQCVPREKISNPTIDGRCIDVYMIFFISGICNIVSDFFILAFPIWAVWQLRMPVTQKLYSSVIFATGLFALLASVLRFHSTSQIPDQGDVSWVIVKVAMWTAAEMTTVLLCCCFPFLPKLVRPAKQKRTKSNVKHSSGSLPQTGRPTVGQYVEKNLPPPPR